MGEPSPFGEHMGGGGINCVGKFIVDACTGCAYVAAGPAVLNMPPAICTEPVGPAVLNVPPATCTEPVGPAVLNVPTATCGAAAGAPRRPSKAAAPPCDVPGAAPGRTEAKDCGAAAKNGAFSGGAAKLGALTGGPKIIDPVSVGAILGGALGGPLGIITLALCTTGPAYIWLRDETMRPAFSPAVGL